MKLRFYSYVFVGTVLEHLDNILFTLFLPVLVDYFFGQQSIDTKWLLAFMSFALYFIVRPIGAVIFGIIGDKFGRKIALLISVLVMSTATLFMGMMPPYSSIGTIATIMFLLLRVLQGLSVGGEYGAAMTYVYDNCDPKKRTFFGSMLIASTHLGGTIAALFALISTLNFQIVFMLAGIIGLLSLKGRLSLIDRYHANSASKYNVQFISNEISKSIKQYLQVFALSSCLVAIFYTTIVYFTKLATVNLGIQPEETRMLNILLLLLWLCITPIVGYAIDNKKLSSIYTMKIASLFMVLFAPITLIYFDYNGYNIQMLLGFQIILSIFHIIFCAPTPKIICALFSNQLRNTNTSLSYSLGSSFTAAAIPFLNDYAYGYLGIKGVGLVISIFALIGFVACMPQHNLLKHSKAYKE